MIYVGKCLAGHAARVQGHKSAPRYDNPLLDLVNLIIAEQKAKDMLAEPTPSAAPEKGQQ